MMIGGFYHIDQVLTQSAPKKCDFKLRCDTEGRYSRKVYTNNGRTATVYALQNGCRLTKDDVILVPDYLCVSVLNALEVSGAQFRFYRIRKDLTVDLEDLCAKMDESIRIIYIIHYFGVPQPAEVCETIRALKKQYGAVIMEDLTQAIYTCYPGRIGYGDYIVASTRKWTPVTDGGLLAVRDGIPCDPAPLGNAYDDAAYRQLLISIYRDYYERHPEDISYYLQLEKEANAARYLDFTPKAMTELSRRIFFQTDHERSIQKRNENYRTLWEGLQDIPGLTLLAKQPDNEGKYGPFGFPVLTEERDAFYQHLAAHGIIGEIQWVLPLQYYTPAEDAQYLSDHNVMLQCDQRYGENEMQQVISCIKEFFGGRK